MTQTELFAEQKRLLDAYIEAVKKEAYERGYSDALFYKTNFTASAVSYKT